MESQDWIGWAAGIYEGEGSIWFRSRKSTAYGTNETVYSPNAMTVRMTDRDVVERFHEVIGRGNFSGPIDKGPGRQDQWQWRVNSHDDIAHVARLLLPYCGSRRSQDLKKALAYIDNPHRAKRLVLGGKCKNGHTLTEQTLMIRTDSNARRCRTCVNTNKRLSYRSDHDNGLCQDDHQSNDKSMTEMRTHTSN